MKGQRQRVKGIERGALGNAKALGVVFDWENGGSGEPGKSKKIRFKH